jgi:hypothetical protein
MQRVAAPSPTASAPIFMFVTRSRTNCLARDQLWFLSSLLLYGSFFMQTFAPQVNVANRKYFQFV